MQKSSQEGVPAPSEAGPSSLAAAPSSPSSEPEFEQFSSETSSSLPEPNPLSSQSTCLSVPDSSPSAVNRNKYSFRINKYCEDDLKYCEYHYEIEKAFQRDCEKFLINFRKYKCLSFKMFTEHWNSCLRPMFLCQEFVTEELPYLADAFFFVIRKIIKYADDNYIKVGAIYLLYAVFSIQNQKSAVRIRLSLPELTHIEEFINELNEIDVQFVFRKLLYQHAFEFVATEQRLGLEPRFLWQQLELKNDIFTKNLIDNPTEGLKDALDLSGLADMSKQFNETLKAYQERSGRIVADIPASTFTNDVVNSLEELRSLDEEFTDLTDSEGNESDVCEEDVRVKMLKTSE